MVDRRLLQVLWKSGAAGGCSTGISHYQRGHLHETENMPCVRKSISSYDQPGILFRCLPGLCKTEIRAGTQTPAAAKLTMICPQLSLKSPWFSRVFSTCFQGGCIRILQCFEMRLSCGQSDNFMLRRYLSPEGVWLSWMLMIWPSAWWSMKILPYWSCTRILTSKPKAVLCRGQKAIYSTIFSSRVLPKKDVAPWQDDV